MNCENCEQSFEAKQRTKRFCSERCRKQAERRRHYERYHFNQEKHEMPCSWCGKAHNRAAGTCSNKCSQDRCRYRSYGVHSLAHLNELKARAGGHCEICGKPEALAAKGTLHCDHNHSTGQVRGMLCMHCNQALGKFGDNIDLLYKAIEYLKR